MQFIFICLDASTWEVLHNIKVHREGYYSCCFATCHLFEISFAEIGFGSKISYYVPVTCSTTCEIWQQCNAYVIIIYRTGSLASLEPDNRNALMLSIDKWNLDDAHKDKQNKIYDKNFKVNLINIFITLLFNCKVVGIAKSVLRLTWKLLLIYMQK